MKIFGTIVIVLILAACGREMNNIKMDNVKLELVWATDTLLSTPESVIYDKQRDVLYVSNVNLNPWEKDNNGFISKMDLNGNIIELEWVKGMHGPKGMGIVNNSLFVTDMDEVVEIDIESAKIINRFTNENESSNLNDITTSANDDIYVTGSGMGTIFQLKDGEFITVVEGDTGTPNGIYVEEDRLLMLGFNSQLLKSLDFATNKITILTDSLGKADGIVPAGKNDYLTSSWAGELYYIGSDYSRTKLLDTQEENINAADIEYIIDKNLLLVPTFYDNRVVAYKIVR